VFDKPTGVIVNKEQMSLSELIYEGADLFLLPARSDSGSISMLRAMGKETIPIARNIGYLSTVMQFNMVTGEGYGFKFQNANSQEMYEAVKEAIETYQHPTQWQKALANLKRQDISWNPSTIKYFDTFLQMTTSSQPSTTTDFDRGRGIKDRLTSLIATSRTWLIQKLGSDKDNAMLSKAGSTAPGGIDLNPTMLNLQVKRDGNGTAFLVAADGTMQVSGFTPVIIRITPMVSPLLSDSG
jgi:hypothetical protein